jgi:hypothetical protein
VSAFATSPTTRIFWITKAAAGLPIGSGEIESGHRYVFQNRLNIAGGLVEDGKPKEDDRSTGLAGEPRLGRLLEQRASESGITDSHF